MDTYRRGECIYVRVGWREEKSRESERKGKLVLFCSVVRENGFRWCPRERKRGG